MRSVSIDHSSTTDQADRAAPSDPGTSSDDHDEAPGARANSRALTIRNRRGLHARASAKFVQTVERFESEVTVERDGMSVGGQSIMGLMMLAATIGTDIHVSAEGPDSDDVLTALEELVANRFGEDC